MPIDRHSTSNDRSDLAILEFFPTPERSALVRAFLMSWELHPELNTTPGGRSWNVANFTIFNCGTGYTRHRNDVVAQLYRDIANPALAMVTDGVGTTTGLKATMQELADAGKEDAYEHTLKEVGSGGFRGNLFAKGLNKNVDLVCQEVMDRYAADKHLQIDMIGWSRGAVTCFKIANKLASLTNKDIPIRIFAIDPVPGSSGDWNHHMWTGIVLTPNVKAYQIVIAQHETRRTFAPVLPPLPGGLSNRKLNIMPGNHSGVVEPMGEFSSPYKLVKDMAQRFLMAGNHERYGVSGSDRPGGTVFKNSRLLTPDEILNKYSKIRSQFSSIRKKAGMDKSNFYGSQIFGMTRKVKTQNAAGTAHKELPKISRKLQGYFVNNHHMEVMEKHYFQLAHALKRPASLNFGDERQLAGALEDLGQKTGYGRVYEDVSDYLFG